MKTSESVAAIAGALAKAQGAMGGAAKGKTNPHFKSRYADLEAVVDALKEALSNNAIAYFQALKTNQEGKLGVETMLLHSSGEWLLGGDECFVPVSKNDPQGFGSATTYLRRYSLMAACGIAPEDDDGNHASAKPGHDEPKSFPSAAIPANVEGQELLATAEPAHRKWIEAEAEKINGLFHSGKNLAEYWHEQKYDHEEQLMLSLLLSAPVRRRIKDQDREIKLAKQKEMA